MNRTGKFLHISGSKEYNFIVAHYKLFYDRSSFLDSLACLIVRFALKFQLHIYFG